MPIDSLFSLTVNAFTYRHTKSVWWLKIICIVRKQSTEQYYYCNTTTRVYDERQLRFISEIKKFSMSNHCRSGFPLRAICVHGHFMLVSIFLRAAAATYTKRSDTPCTVAYIYVTILQL